MIAEALKPRTVAGQTEFMQHDRLDYHLYLTSRIKVQWFCGFVVEKLEEQKAAGPLTPDMEHPALDACSVWGMAVRVKLFKAKSLCSKGLSRQADDSGGIRKLIRS